jgi:ABC-type nitrate/sulfonate/bicarbonate transport system permease component
MKQLFTPFEVLKRPHNIALTIGWLVVVFGTWYLSTTGQKHLLPTPQAVLQGLGEEYKEGIVHHALSSLALCFQATFWALLISLPLGYLSTLPAFRPFVQGLSKFRYLPLTGITFYLATSPLISSGRSMQVGVLVIFMSVYFVTSLLSVIADIPEEEFDHARSLKMNRWEVLWHIIIRGRIDYAIEILRQNLAIVWMMLVTVESIVMSAGGLGTIIKNADRYANHGRIFAAQLVILLIGIGIDYALSQLRYSFPYVNKPHR